MKRNRDVLPATVLLSVAIHASTASASTTIGDRQEIDVRTLKQAADWYFDVTGRYPTNDASSTWFQKLVAGNYVHTDNLMCGTRTGAPLPVDLFGRPLVYEVPNPNRPASAIIRCTGEDGVDNQGAGDDLDSRFGPNWGYWNKSNWPEFVALTVGGWVVALASGLSVWFHWRRRIAACIVFLLIVGIVPGLIVPMIFSAGHFENSATRLPQWGNFVCVWSCMAAPVAAFLGLIVVVRWKIRNRRQLKFGLCPICDYNLRGASHQACPECGAAVNTIHVSTDRAPLQSPPS